MKILSVFGTRPEAIKMSSLIKLFAREVGNDAKVCITAQHREMLDPLLKLFQIEPDYDLDIMRENQSLIDISTKTMQGIQAVINEHQPDRIIVQGDTTTSAVTALVAFYNKIPITHVEAGLRSYNRYSPWPEEINRKLITCITDMHCAPTQLAYTRLLAEGISADEIFLTGNTVIDVLYEICERLDNDGYLNDQYQQKFNFLNDDEKPLILVTGHRRESFGKPFEEICQAIKYIAEQENVNIVYPVHLNPNVQKPVNAILEKIPNIHLIEPVDYVGFVYLMRQAHLILTDSGGIQEEAPALGTPVLIMRDVTERPEAIDAGTSKLVSTKKENIISGVCNLLNDKQLYESMHKAHSPFGDGKSSERIFTVIKEKYRHVKMKRMLWN